MAEDEDNAVNRFVERWERSGAAERANYQLFLSELCDIIGVPRPNPATDDDSQNDYVFERSVVFQHGDGTTSTGRIDLYKRGCFALEAKQGSNVASAEEPLSEAARELKHKLKVGTAKRGTPAWDDAMLRAKGQGDQYIRALPPSEGRPPFLVVVDVGHSVELFSEFSCTGGTYVPFPAPGSHRVFISDLARPDIRERLKLVWTAPHELDPSRRSAKVTRDVAASLARLAVSLEAQDQDPHKVAAFLMRCLFTMFAEDVGLLMRNGFANLLKSASDAPESFTPLVEELWRCMDKGGFSTSLRTTVLQFNGGLFEDATALPLNKDQLQLLIEAAQCDWREVEPAIFGTLLERALDPIERHKLGAHYTPRSYVERLVMPTIIEPVRADWDAAHAAAVTLAKQGDLKKAAAEVKLFHRRLCNIRVLDPACGSGNFLYVTLEHLKRIEGEVFDTLNSLGDKQAVLDMAGETVDPHQFLGLEINPRAAAIAELVLWIGTLQWHFRTRGSVRPPQPIIRNFKNIQCRDALIEYDREEPVLDVDGKPVTRWDGRTMKQHPVTGQDVPDETARVTAVRYVNPRAAQWPEADYIVGNPPFIGPALMRQSLGDGYCEAVRQVHSDIGESSNFVMYWWNNAARLVREGKVRRFGFVTTNNLRQTFNRRVLEAHLTATPPLSVIFAIPNHPWVDASDGAAVRIAMTVGIAGRRPGLLSQSLSEKETDGGDYSVEFVNTRGSINADLTIGVDIAGSIELLSNAGLALKGFELGSQGFVVERESAESWLAREPNLRNIVRPYMNGRDLTCGHVRRFVIDLHGMTEADARKYDFVFQHILDRVQPERAVNRESRTAKNWWLFRRSGEDLRVALHDLSRAIATTRTARHRIFQFIPASLVAESKIVVVASDDAYVHGVLSAHLHVVFAEAAGGWLGVGDDPTYNHVDCFNKYPFPEASEAQKQRIRDVAEQLDAHRKQRQAEHTDLTLTDMYNVLENLRAGNALTAKEKKIHEQGLVSVLKQLHDELDAAVFEAYGWPATLTDAQILERLVALNAERAAEEARGVIRWLRPEFQAKGQAVVPPAQPQLPLPSPADPRSTSHVPRSASDVPQSSHPAWPKALPDQVRLLRELLAAQSAPVTAAALAKSFTRARTDRIEELLQTLVTLGQAKEVGKGKYVA